MTCITKAQQEVLTVENSLLNLQLDSIKTGNYFLQINGAVETDLKNQAAGYAKATSIASDLNGFISGGGTLSWIFQIAGVLGVCFAPSEGVLKIAGGLAKAGATSAMITETVAPAVEAHYDLEEASRGYNTSVDTTAMKQLTQDGTVFAGQNESVSQTARAVAAALAAEITDKNSGERSTTRYGV